MNRYTQHSVSEFKPLSFQELAVAPAMMRGQHNQAIAQQEQMRNDLTASANPLPQHLEESRALSGAMNQMIDSQADDLMQKGFNNNTGSSLIKLNREFKNLTGPMGRLGQINAANQKYSAEYKAFRDSAEKNKWSTDDINRNWAKHVSSYSGYDRDGNISAIGGLGAPEQRRVIDALKDIKGMIGSTQRRLDAMGGGSIIPREDGSFEVRNSSGQKIQDTNVKQLNDAAKLLYSDFLLPTGVGYKSAQFEGISPEKLQMDIRSGLDAMLVDKITDNRSQSVSLSAAKNWKDAKKENDEYENLAFESIVKSAPNALTVNGYDKNIQNLNTLKSKLNAGQKLSAAEAESLTDLERYQSEVTNNLKSDPNYKAHMENAKIKANALGIKNFDPNKLSQTTEDKLTPRAGSNLTNISLTAAQDLKNSPVALYDGKRLTPQMQEYFKSPENQALLKYRDNAANSLSTRSVMTSIVPTGTKSQAKEKVYLNNMNNALAMPGIIGNQVNPSQITGSLGNQVVASKASKEELNADISALVSSAVGTDRFNISGYSQGGYGNKNAGMTITVKVPNGPTDKDIKIGGKTFKKGELVTVDLNYDSSAGNQITNIIGGQINSRIVSSNAGGAPVIDEYGRQLNTYDYSASDPTGQRISLANRATELENREWRTINPAQLNNPVIINKLQTMVERYPALQKYTGDMQELLQEIKENYPNHKLNSN